jgi:hypothetical protein
MARIAIKIIATFDAVAHKQHIARLGNKTSFMRKSNSG